jgi:hypothetical protein
VNFENVKLFYGFSCVLMGLLILSPALMAVVPLPEVEQFSELWLLGPNRTTEGYPSDVMENESYLVYVGVGNHLGSLTYYALQVKFRSQTEPLPNVTTGEPSLLPALYEYRVFVAENGSLEVPLAFSFFDVNFGDDTCFVGSVVINGISFSVDKAVSWDEEKNGYYYQIFVELWIYDSELNGFSFHNRFVSCWLNMVDSV